MPSEKQIREAKAVYDSFKAFLDSQDFHYTVVAEETDKIYVIQFGLQGDDIPMNFHVFIQVERGIIKFVSKQPVKFETEKRLEAALALCAINDTIADGSYAMDLEDGTVLYSQTSCFRGSLVSDEVFHYMLGMSGAIVDEYNDKLLMLQMGALDLEAFLKAL